MSIKQKTVGNSVLLIPESMHHMRITPQLFDPQFLSGEERVERVLTGRGKVYFFNWSEHLLALRHYYRGGAIAKLSDDRFIYTGINNTRCYQELNILAFLQSNQVNVPTPVAAIVQKEWFTYRASIITEVIEDACELDALLGKQHVADEIWYKIGQQIRKMHDLQVCHYDLNVKNILLQHNSVYLIDFDKCVVKSGNAWKTTNIERLKRSLHKQKGLQANYHYQETCFNMLLKGYHNNP